MTHANKLNNPVTREDTFDRDDNCDASDSLVAKAILEKKAKKMIYFSCISIIKLKAISSEGKREWGMMFFVTDL